MKRDAAFRFTFWRSALCVATIALAPLVQAPRAEAKSLEDLAARQQAKLEDAVKRLNAQRAQIEAEQLPLSRQLNDLSTQARALRDELKQSRAIRDSRAVTLEQLASSVEAQEKEYDYITRVLFGEFISASQTSLSAGEHATHGEHIREHNLFLEDPSADDLARTEASLELLDRSMDRIESLIGGRAYAGSALSESGTLESGAFVQVGPLLYFSGGDPGNSGWVVETKALQPKVRPLSPEAAAQINSVAQSGQGPLPIDATLGDAIAIAETEESLGEHLRRGGVWVYPIIGFAFIATLVALFKLAQIFSIRHPQPLVVHDLVKLIREGKQQEARGLAEQQPAPSREMLVAAVDNSGESVELVEEVMYESMLNTQPRLERFLNVIAVTAATAPLLGLLGTVTGIIKTFKLMKVFGAGDPKPLISGISEALITTELGLVLAIPALVVHAMLARKVSGILARMEKLSVAFVNGLSRRQPAASPPRKEVADDA